METSETLVVILATGSGSGLVPLTVDRTLAAVPFGGNFRIIDFPLTNCLRSGFRQVFVLSYYKSHSLHEHLRDGWSIHNAELGEFVTPIAPQMRDSVKGYRDIRDALKQNWFLLERSNAKWIVLLAGDEIYRMDYAAMLRFHKRTSADVTVACVEGANDQPNVATVYVSQDQKVVATQPVPNAEPARAMGAYIFSREKLEQMLQQIPQAAGNGDDLGVELLPMIMDRMKLMAYRFGGVAGRVKPDRYWRKLASIDDYYDASMGLLELDPQLDLYQSDWAIRTYQPQVPPARTVPGRSANEGVSVNSIVAAGAVITGGGVNHSVLFPSVRVNDSAIVEDSILLSDVVVEEGAHVRNCVIDKGVRIPRGEEIGFDASANADRFHVTPKGVVVIPKDFSFG